MVVAVDQSDLVTESWPKATNQEGNKLRNISYTLSLNYSIGPKVSPTSEKQVSSPPNDPGIHVSDFHHIIKKSVYPVLTE